MACRVLYYPDTKKVNQVFTSDGVYSKLFRELTALYKGDKDAAYNAYLKTQTQAFKTWFEGSEIIDGNGEPQVVYHAGTSSISTFDKGESKQPDSGFWFADSVEAATNFFKIVKHSENPFMHPVFLNIKNPKLYLEGFWNWGEGSYLHAVEKMSRLAGMPGWGDKGALHKTLMEEGHDGVVIGDDAWMDAFPQAKGEQFTAFEPNQIKHATDNLGEFNKDVQDIYAQKESETAVPPNAELNSKLYTFLEQIGVSIETVKQVKDRDGNPIDAIAAADMMTKIIQFVEGKADGLTLPEEASHFFVQLLKQNDSPLYTAMRNRIQDYNIYDEVVEEYSALYEGNVQKLADEAIGKLISRHLLANVDTTVEDLVEDAEKLSRAKRWWQRVLAYLRKVLGNIMGNPYKLAAYRMLNEGVKAAKDVQMASEDILYQTEAAEPVTQQDKVVISALEHHEALRKETMPIEGIPNLKKDIVMEGEVEKEVYIYTDPLTQKETIIPERVTNVQKRAFVKRNRKVAEKFNTNPRNIHLAKGGVTLHGAAQNLVEYLGNKSDLVEIVTTEKGRKLPTSTDEAMTVGGKKLSVSLQGIKTSFVAGVSKLVKQFEDKQKEINKIDGTPNGKVKLLTELQIPDLNPPQGGLPTAGTMDIFAVFSNGKVGILDFKFITPQGWYTTDYGTKKKIVLDPMQVRIEGYNTQVGAYKDMVSRLHGVPIEDFIYTRIVPTHVQYEVKNWRKKNYTLTDKIEVFEMGIDQSQFMKQLAVAGELTSYKSLNKFLKKLYGQRKTFQQSLPNLKGKKRERALDRIKQIDRTIQGVVIERNIAVILTDAAESIKVISKRLHITDPKDPDYLHMEDLRDLLQDFGMYNALNQETSDYLDDLEAVDPVKAKIVRQQIASGANYIQKSYATVQMRMFEILTSEGTADDIDLNEPTKQIKWAGRELTPMSVSAHPIVRYAYKAINESFNKTKQETDAIWEEIMKYDKALGVWASKNGMSKFEAFKRLLNPETGNLIARFKQELWDTIKEKQEEGDIKWLKKNLQRKKGSLERYNAMLKERQKSAKGMYPDHMENGKIVKSNASMRNSYIDQFERKWSLEKHDSAWQNPRWQSMLEFTAETIADNETDEYKELQTPENKELFEYYSMYSRINEKFNKISPGYIQGNFVSNTRDDMIQSVVNNGKFLLDGINMKSFFDRMSRTLTNRHAEEFSEGVIIDGNKVAQIPIPGLAPLRNSKEEIDVSLKSKDLSKSLYSLALSMYNYKHMSEIEARVLALGDMLEQSEATMTDRIGNIRRDDGSPVTKNLMAFEGGRALYDSYQRLIAFYLYGQTTQTEDTEIFGVSVNKLTKTLMSWYSAKVLALPVYPALAAKTLGEVNLYIQSLDGISYDREGMKKSNRMWLQNHTQYSFFANYFDIHQTPGSWHKHRDLAAKRAARIGEFGNIYAPLKWTDESLDRRMVVAMGYKHGITEDGQIRRLDQLPEGAKNLHELTIKTEDGGFMIQGITEEAFADFRLRAKEEGRKIKGQMDSENIVAAKTQLMGQMLGQFKWWMPGLLAERFKGRQYHPVLKYFEEGRYPGFAREITDGAFAADKGIRGNLLGVLKSGTNLIMELTMLKKFAGDPGRRAKLMAKDKWTDTMEENYQAKRESLELEMDRFKMNSTDPKILDMTVEEFMRMRTRSVKRSLSEIRSIIGMYLLFNFLGAVGPDDEKFMQQHYGTRQIMKVLGRARRELGFVLDPREFTIMLRGGIPMIGLLNDAIKVITNGSQEVYKIMMGEQTIYQAFGFNRGGRDHTPLLYNFSQFIPGVTKARQIIEPFPQDKRNPYK